MGDAAVTPLTRVRRVGAVHRLLVTGVAAGFFLIAVASCEPGVEIEERGVVVSDSAGVTLVENPGPLAPDEVDPARRVRLDGPPLLRLGSEAPDAPDFFGRVNTAHFDSRGDLWVVDAIAGELRVFAVPSGEHRFTTGGRGDGPGEFQLPFPIGFDESTAWIWDQGHGRLTVLSLEGERMETRRVGEGLELVPRLLHRRGDGTFLAHLPQTMSGPVSEGMIIDDTLRIWAFEEEPDEPRLLAERQGVTWYFTGRMQVPVPFAQGSRFALRDFRIVLTEPHGAPEFDIIEDGRLTHRVRVAGDRVAVTAEATQRELESPVRSEAAQEAVRANLTALDLPDFIPTWEWVRIGRSGHIFALRYGGLTSDERWDIFDPEGVHLGLLELPPETHLAEADHRYLVLMEMPETRGPGIALHEWPQAWSRRD
jgi:hypothetical protein